MRAKTTLLNTLGVAILALSIAACKKSTPPSVMIHDAISTSYTSANVTGEVTDEGSSSVTERGFVYGKQGESRQDTMFCGSGVGEFPTRLTGLELNTTYNCFAFAKNDGGIGTSGKVTFTTRDNDLPTLETGEVENVGTTTATCGGNVMDDGGADITERGVCWGTNHNPTATGNHASAGNGLGEFTCNMTGLSANATYYVRAYATNSKGTSYGEQKTFTTTAITQPIVTTNNVTAITATSATCGGNVTADGGATVTSRGVCWGTSQSPTVSGSHTSNGNGTGSYTSSITGLSPNTTYYVRAYATNSAGTAYGTQKTFTTPKVAPTGGINALYSVSGTKKVWFSRGNLQYRASTNTWRFAESQLDYIGSNNANISPSYSGWIDLFGWGTGNNPTNTSTNSSSYSTFVDWGSKPISNGGNTANQWCTLTKDEWAFLMLNRSTTSGIRYAKATVNGVAGVIILPDNWSTSYYTLSSTNSTTASFSSNTISSSNWASSFESHGAVFLPAAGYRFGTSVYYVGSYGYYWSASYYNSYFAYYVYF